ncbi:EpsG family protein [Rheinheimera metallidurans]|uniref:EpsG family protein n=1 Tax=Rheinheimera metallidurans TaxID=2925781 RepID=UPI0030026448
MSRIMCGFVFFSFYGLSGHIGTDWYNYLEMYNNTSLGLEPGFTFLMNLVSVFNGNYQVFKALYFLIFIYFFNRLLKIHCISPSLAYFLLMALAPILFIDSYRNALGIVIAMQAIPRIGKIKWNTAVLWILLASLFHISSLLFLVVFVFNKWISRKNLLIIAVAVAFFGLFLLPNFLLDIIVEYVANYFQLEARYLYYFIDIKPYGISIGLVEKLFSLMVMFYFYNTLKEKNTQPILFNMSFFYVLIYLTFFNFEVIINRLSLIFILPYFYVLIYSSSFASKRSNRALILVFIFTTGLLKVALSYSSEIYKYDNVLIEPDAINKRVTVRDKHYLL